MAALVTIAQAKAHLHVTDDDHNADIYLKVVQASGIILDYLKVRLTAIESISVANPTVITTIGPHSLQNGAISTISGTTTTPTVNGAQVITVTGATTFTVPVNVTVGQADEAGDVATPTWTTATVPGPVQAAVLLMLAHLEQNRGDNMETDEDVWTAIGRLLMRLRDPALA